MRLHHTLAGGLAILALAAAASPARAEPVRSPLQVLPDQADLLIQVPQPARLVESVVGLEAFDKLRGFSAVREFMDSTTYRRFQQFVTYFERELGAPWPQLLDRLAGGGVALGAKFGDKAPALLVVRGRDEELMKKLVKVGLDLIQQELARQEILVGPLHDSYQGVETIHLGNDFHAALSGTTLLLSNKQKALEMGLDLLAGKGGKSLADRTEVTDSAKIVPAGALLSFWLDMDVVRMNPQVAAAYKKPPRDDPTLTTLFGPYLNVLGRTPYVSGGILRRGGEFVLTFRLPVGRDGMGVEQALHTPPKGKPGSRPNLEPKGVIYSDSFYLDVSRIWEDREKLYTKQQAEALERVSNDSSRIPISGVKVSDLLTNAGAYHRVVVVNQPEVGYKVKPKQPVPAFAFVTEMRNPDEFARVAETAARGGALLASTQVNLKLVEEKVGDINLVGYRFPEDGKLRQDVNDIRFNFSPCFARVGNQFMVCSTLELGRELVGTLSKEKATPHGNAAIVRRQFYLGGLADAFAGTFDQLVTQAILDQALPAEKAQEEVKAFLAFLRTLGPSGLEVTFTEEEFHFDIRVGTGK